MSLSDIAVINVSTTSAGVTRAGYGVPLILSHSANWVERVRTYASTTAVGQDFAVNSPEYLAAAKIFGQSPKLSTIRIGRAANKAAEQVSVGVQAVALNTPYRVRVAIPTGVVFPSQDATYNPGGGATGWVPSNTWSKGDLVVADGSKLFSCLGPSSASYENGFTGIGAASGPSGTDAAIREGGVYWMYAGSGNTGSASNDAIVQGLKARVEALGAPTAVGTGVNQVVTSLQGGAGSRTLRLLAATPSGFFGLRVYDRNALNAAMDHADPGVAADLDAIVLESNDWYGLITLFNSEALVAAAAAWVETNTKMYPAASIDTQVARVAETSSATDIAHDLKALAYARSWVFFHPSNDEFADAAEFGKFAVVSPGGETWRLKTLAGVTVEAFTETEKTNLKAKYAHFYYALGGVNVVGGEAKTAEGDYVDVTRFLDWYTSELQARLANLLIQNDKIPYTNPGIDLVEAEVTAQNRAGIAAGGIAADPAPVVTAPDVADVSAADKAARELNGVTTEWTLAGAIHKITVSVTASV